MREFEASLPAPPVPMTPMVAAPLTPSNVRRRRPRAQEVRKGAWTKIVAKSTTGLMKRTLAWTMDVGAVNWAVLKLQRELGKAIVDLAVAQTDVSLILVSRLARKMKKPQPSAGPLEEPLPRQLVVMLFGKDAQA